ncbi:MAG: PSD1 and planctomycete cytochrome C domain-containing protein [Pirellulales bacterium]|nr:PSD1 and planctomycete cytochrome C domain-containing protein [Pirellulales bacterium]
MSHLHNASYAAASCVRGTVIGVFAIALAPAPLVAAEVDFARSIASILEQRCASCHGPKKQEGGLDVTSRESLLKGGDSGAAVAPGDIDASVLLDMMSGDEPAMPKGGKPLTIEQIARFRQWIKEGASWPDGVTVSAELWSLRPIVCREPPLVQNNDWVKTPIDALIADQLAANGLEPSPQADRITLIRRATFDLHGLPPTPEEVDEFVADKSTDAFAKVVDRLLKSPRYGERWGRHWLDLASYADSHGFELDYPRFNAWRYRDYVIQAFNNDTPYDEFLTEQIAGDVIAPGDPEGIIATGFLTAGPWDYSGFITAIQGTAASRGTRLTDLDNMLTTVATTTIGLTVGCAKCHDHKFDPIPQKDYYSLQAVFAGVRRGDRVLKGQVTPEQSLRMEQLRLDIHKKRIGVAENDALAAADRTEETAKTRATLIAEIAALEAEYAKLPEVELTYSGVPETPPSTHVLHRGDTESPRERVAPAALSAVHALPAELTNANAPEGERRLALAHWLTDPKNPLMARVMVNRIWHYHFGRGIVGTPGDFGFNGERPSHPELLDWLASEFQQRKWSIKEMHRLIMLSSTYQQSSQRHEKGDAFDAGNQLVWRMNRRRMDAEVVRDSVLAVSGQLDLTMGGPAFMPFRYEFRKSPLYDYFDRTPRPQQTRRSVYNFIARSTPDPFMDVLDFPVPSSCTPARNSTTTPLQSLSLLNDPFIIAQAEHFARRLSAANQDDTSQAKLAYRLALGREPSGRELEAARDFIAKHRLFHFCRALLNSNEFAYVD